MDIIGAEVKHKSFGRGIILDRQENYIKIRFDQGEVEKQFIYPDAFEKYLTITDADLQQQVMAALEKKKQRQLEEELRQKDQKKVTHIQSPSVAVTQKGKNSKKIPKRKNLAFKLNYCDGGRTNSYIVSA